MWKFNFFSFVYFLGTLSLSLPVLASEATFKPVYTDSHGVIWAEEIRSETTNGCTDPEGKLDHSLCSRRIVSGKDSMAQAICDRIGARLPTFEETENLILDFDHTDLQYFSHRLSAQGTEDLAKAFKTDKVEDFWTSLVAYADFSGAFMFTGHDLWHGSRGPEPHTWRISSVRCVRNPSDPQRAPIGIDSLFDPMIAHGALAIMSDGSVLTSDGMLGAFTRGEYPLQLKRFDSHGKIDPTFSPDIIPPSASTYHSIASVTQLKSDDFLMVVNEHCMGSCQSSYDHIRKIDRNGKLVRRFGKNGVVAFGKLDRTKQYFRYVQGFVELPDGKILGYEDRIKSDPETFGHGEQFVFRLLPSGKFDYSFGDGGFVRVSEIDPFRHARFRIFPNEQGFLLVESNKTKLGISQFSHEGKLIPASAEQDSVKVNLTQEACELRQLDASDTSLMALLFCPVAKKIKVVKINERHELEPGYMLEFSPTLEGKDILTSAGMTLLRNQQILLSYTISTPKKTSQDSANVKWVRSQLFAADGKRLDWEARFFMPEGWKTEAFRIFSKELPDGGIMLHIPSQTFYEDSVRSGFWLKTTAPK